MEHDIHAVVDFGHDRGLVVQARQVRVAAPAQMDGGALGPGVLNVGLDNRQLPVPEYRADVLCKAVFRPLLQVLAFLQHQAQEFIVDLADHVDALGAAAIVAGVHAGSQPGAVGGAVQIGVRADDHGIVAAEFQGAGDELTGACFRHLAPGGDTAGEGDLVDPAADDGGSRVTIPQQHLQHPRRQAGIFQYGLGQFRGKGRDLGALGHHRVARKNGLHCLVHDQYKGAIPGCDQTDHPQRLVEDTQLLGDADDAVYPALARLEKTLRVLGVVAQGIRHRENLHAHGIGAGLAGFRDHGVDDLILALQHQLQGALGDFHPLPHRRSSPGRLGRARNGDRRCHIVGVGADQLAAGLQGDRAAQLQVAAGIGGFNRFVQGHGGTLRGRRGQPN